ncbi:hypothetical protein ACIPSK_25415 [Rhizobium sp. LARHSG275]|nr:hypothetical protein [Rhizobium laguerreae]
MALLYGCMELLDKVSRNGSGEDGPSEALTRPAKSNACDAG